MITVSKSGGEQREVRISKSSYEANPTVGRRVIRALLAASFVAVGALQPGTLLAEVRPPPLDIAATPAAQPTKSVLLAITRAGLRLVAVGERGTVLLSDDGGRNWRQARVVPVSVALTAVQFTSPSEGWAVGHMGVVLHTQDGGVTWKRRLDGIQAAALVLAHAREAAPGPGRKDEPGAAVKSAMRLVADGPDKPFLNLTKLSSGEILIVGAYGLALVTRDAGLTWTSAVDRFENPKALHLYGLARQGDITYAAGEQGLFLRSRPDGGFAKLATPYPGTFFGILALGSRTVLAFGLRGTILRSDDGGTHWRAVPSGTVASLSYGQVLSDGRVVLASLSGQFVVSHDGGASFAPEGKPAPEPIAGFAETPDKALVVVGPRGVFRIAEPAPGKGAAA
jgi:photosystem II stability/assembly factor-like uncharacterized protein